MKKIRRITAVILTACIVMGAAGCSNTKKAAKEAELNWWYCGNGIQKDTAAVEAKLNEMLHSVEGMENITVHLKSNAGNDHTTAVTLGLSAGEQIDILGTNRLVFSELVEDGTAMEIDEYLESADDLKEIIPEWLWKMCQIDGKTYMIPNYQRASNMAYIVVPKEYADAYENFDNLRQVLGRNDASLAEIESEMENLLLAVRAKFGNEKYLLPFASLWHSSMGINDHYDIINGNIVKYDKSDKVVHKSLTEKSKEAYGYSAEWFEKGYFPAEILTMNQNDMKGKNMMNNKSFILTNVNFIGSEEAVSNAYTKTYGFDVYALPVKNKYYISNVWAAGGHCITPLCKNPQAAVDFLNFLYSEEGKDVYNLIVYGIEGTHYEKIDDTHIKTLEYDTTQGGVNTSYAAYKWNMGNAFNAYLNQGCVDGENELSLEINNSKDNVVSDLLGFYAKTSDIESELSQIATVDAEYSNSLALGVMGSSWEKTYDEYEAKLKTAGLEKVLNEVQTQVNDFLSE